MTVKLREIKPETLRCSATPSADNSDVKVTNPTHHWGMYKTTNYPHRKSQEDSFTWSTFANHCFETLSPGDIGKRLWTAYRVLDQEVCELPYNVSGATASTTVYDGRGNFITAQLGDSCSFAAIYDKEGHLIGVKRLNSITHKPEDPLEKARIEAAGGFVSRIDATSPIPRVNGRLSLSRALGDIELKQNGVTSEARIDIHTTQDMVREFNVEESEIGSIKVITTCDGFTDGVDIQTKKSHEDYLLALLTSAQQAGIVGEAEEAQFLVNSALDGVQGVKSTDNISVVVQTIDMQSASKNQAFLHGIYDGHGGPRTAIHTAIHMVTIFEQQCQLSTQMYQQQALSVEKNQAIFDRDHPPAFDPYHLDESTEEDGEEPFNPRNTH